MYICKRFWDMLRTGRVSRAAAGVPRPSRIQDRRHGKHMEIKNIPIDISLILINIIIIVLINRMMIIKVIGFRDPRESKTVGMVNKTQSP